MLTPITIQTYNTLLAKKKTLIEMFFDVGISLATTKSNYMNDFIASLATFTNANEANMHIENRVNKEISPSLWQMLEIYEKAIHQVNPIVEVEIS